MQLSTSIREVINIAPSTPDPRARAPVPDGLTALHIAAIKVDGQGRCDKKCIRQLLREHPVDGRTSSGATPLMLACLFGRTDAFWTLLTKNANMNLRDDQGLSASQYTLQDQLSPGATLIRRYRPLAGAQASRSGRKRIKMFLDAQVVETPQAKAVPVGAAPVEAGQVQNTNPVSRILFTRRGGIFEILEVRRSLTFVEIYRDLGRKTCGGIRGKGEEYYRAIAMSGWQGEAAKQVATNTTFLDNAEYLQATRAIATNFGYEFHRNMLDCCFPGTVMERAGMFSACHAEKQLAVFVLKKALRQVLGVEEVTTDNVAKLRDFVVALPEQARTESEKKIDHLQTHFTIELEHKPCSCCIAFMELISKKSGLRFQWLFRAWFVEGKRPKLKLQNGRVVRANWNALDAIDDELDETGDGTSFREPEDGNGDTDWAVVQNPYEEDVTMTQASENDEDWTVLESNESLPRRKPASFGIRKNRQQPRNYPMPLKEGSVVPETEYPIARKNKVKQYTVLTRRKIKDTRRRRSAIATTSDIATFPDAVVNDSINSNAVTSPNDAMDIEGATSPATVASSQPSPVLSPSTGRNLTPFNFAIPIRAVDLSSSPISPFVPVPFPDVSKWMSTYRQD